MRRRVPRGALIADGDLICGVYLFFTAGHLPAPWLFHLFTSQRACMVSIAASFSLPPSNVSFLSACIMYAGRHPRPCLRHGGRAWCVGPSSRSRTADSFCLLAHRSPESRSRLMPNRPRRGTCLVCFDGERRALLTEGVFLIVDEIPAR